MKKMRDRIIDGVKGTLENLRDGKRLMELEIEVQALRHENRKLKKLLKDARDNLSFVSVHAKKCAKGIRSSDVKDE
jgi:acylphosphatase